VFHGGRTGGHGVERAISSSATRIEKTLGGPPGDVPDEATEEDIRRTIADYVHAAKNAIPTDQSARPVLALQREQADG
jgi:2,4-dienoyl-CoA reductase-like NADH-dependent reductase (Old Yellow Enzyme family)